MRNWMDLNGDGEIDSVERMFAAELLCTSREEHIAFLVMQVILMMPMLVIWIIWIMIQMMIIRRNDI